MTYCEDIGLKVGDKIKFIGYGTAGRHFDCRVGDVLTLKRDDRTSSPCFSIAGGDELYFNLEYREWIKIEEENKTIKRNDKVNVEMTAEEVVRLKLLLAILTDGVVWFNTYEKLRDSVEGLDLITIHHTLPIDTSDLIKESNILIKDFFTPKLTPKQQKIKELEETINKAQKELQEYKALTQGK